MNSIKSTLILGALLLTQPMTGVAAGQDDMFGVWGSLMLQGDFKFLSPSLDKVHWLILNQGRTREDSPNGSRFTENLLFSQIGYQLDEHASFWLGYAHDWVHSLHKSAFQESRPYLDFVWNQHFGEFKLTSRTRMEDRINQTTGNEGYRARQLIQFNHPLPFMEKLSAYAGDEIMFYMNQTNWGKQGFTENRIFGGLNYQVTDQMGLDLGYMGQYIDTRSGDNVFTHNLQANVRYKF